ncbi:hypothetical protein HG263_04940 [Pseudoalteromonas sp. JBTF-M23]|uniref:NACHT domain-containing protein n=1 Tax=Pseudoalteromonas caenipelagi TaxID=2726988 RepID=A0A849VDW0_9GAMM|nr:NACHT domain-containing protein [Pseudoalteromonas caenipelagi]NOU49881.1 hypothetical protein [Pseudoalteromonas caenipelagi]
MRASKGRFALTALSSIITCFALGLTAMSSSLPNALASKASEALGFGPLNTSAPTLVVLILTLITMLLIYRFASKAVLNWDAKARLSEVNLSDYHLENSLFFLSVEKIKLIYKGKSDPIANEAVANWKDKEVDVPKALETKDLLRDMITSAIRELSLPDGGWRDEGQMWVGEILGVTQDANQPVIAFVFDAKPEQEHLAQRLSKIQAGNANLRSFRVYAMYQSRGEDKGVDETLVVDGIEVEILSSRKMILMGLDLHNYAREIIRTFRETCVGGTTATLENSFVDLNFKAKGSKSNSSALGAAIDKWLLSKSNIHLAITGEYGQGKSTALTKYCFDWAEQFLKTGNMGKRIPLLIELRGQSPSEAEPLGFISGWCARYRLQPQQVMNLIKSGDALIIFEGFDELRNAGRAYYRHQHFNALWRFAYPNTKLIFTGRPNFFLDEEEVNRTLRSQESRAMAGDVYTQVWELEKLTIEQIERACRSYDPQIRNGIINSINESDDFYDIVSRPSMLPVVATIWPQIEELKSRGIPLTGAELMERYIQAIFSRKEAELEADRVQRDAPVGSRYLVLPKQVRELLTICVAWRMSGLGLKNTIARSEITEMVKDCYDTLVTLCKSEGVSAQITEDIIEFERRHAEDKPVDRVDAITSEICTAGLLVKDVTGGGDNLRFPHKQFFEFLLAKAIAITSDPEKYSVAVMFDKCSSDVKVFPRLINEPNAVRYLSECIGPNFKQIVYTSDVASILLYLQQEVVINRVRQIGEFFRSKFRSQRSSTNALRWATYSLDGDFNEVHYELQAPRYKSPTDAGMIPFGLIFITALVSSNFEQYILDNMGPVYLVSVGMLLSSALALHAHFIFRISDNKHAVVMQFFRAHWSHAGQKPKDREQELHLVSKSLRKKDVVFPNEQITLPKSYSQFVYPAKDFGKAN